jgi:glycosyltransferase EpsH
MPCSEKKVSVIVPVYNTVEYIRPCLESLVNQTLKEIEIICIDDGSTDGSEAILEEYAAKDSRIVVIHQGNEGTANARNRGLRVASAPYIGFVDSDDFIAPAMYEKMYRAMIGNNVEMVYCGAYVYYNYAASKAGRPDIESWFSQKSGRIENRETGSIDGLLWNKLFIREIIEKYGIYFPPGMNGIEDNYLPWCYFAVTAATWFINEKLYYYFVRR